jgi:hypothetical protein
MTNAVVLAQGAGVNLTNRNLIINGAMTVAQRATTHATSVTNGYHTVDRFKIGGNSSIGQWTSSQDTDVPAGFSKSYKLECTTADTSLAVSDHIGITYTPEGYSMDSVSKGTPDAKPMTLSFYMKASVLKTMVVEMTDASNSRHVNYSVIPSATNTWERIVINIPADTSGSFNQGTNSKAAEINFWLGAGTNYTSGTTQATWTARTAANIMAGVSNWADTVGNTIWITGLQLEVGTVATPFEHRSYGQELALCQRYYQKYSNDTDPNGSIGTGIVWTSTVYFMSLPYQTPMRATPTASYSAATAITLLVNAAAKQAGSIGFQNQSKVALEVSGTSSSMTAGMAGFMRLTSQNDYLALSAEL